MDRGPDKHSFRSFLLVACIGWTVGASMSGAALADTMKIGGTGGAMGTIKALTEAFKKSHSGDEVILIPGLGSGGARRALLGGAIEIAVTSKPGKKLEKLEGAMATVYGRTPFVFATSIKNPASSLTTQELVDIWNGKRITWPDGRRLRLILRPESDSDTDVLKSISPTMAEAVKNALSRQGMRMAVTDGDSADAMESIQGALGTSTLALIFSEKRALKALVLDGVTPSPKAIADGSYPYFKSMYVVTRPSPSGLAQQFVSFVFSAQGRSILEQIGYWVAETK